MGAPRESTQPKAEYDRRERQDSSARGTEKNGRREKSDERDQEHTCALGRAHRSFLCGHFSQCLARRNPDALGDRTLLLAAWTLSELPFAWPTRNRSPRW